MIGTLILKHLLMIEEKELREIVNCRLPIGVTVSRKGAKTQRRKENMETGQRRAALMLGIDVRVPSEDVPLTELLIG